MIEVDGEGEADEDKDKREQIINKLPVVKRLSGLPDTSDLHYVQSCSRFACLMAGITFPGCSSFEGADEYSAGSATVDDLCCYITFMPHFQIRLDWTKTQMREKRATHQSLVSPRCRMGRGPIIKEP